MTFLILIVGEFRARELRDNRGRSGRGRLCPVCRRPVAVLLVRISLLPALAVRRCPVGIRHPSCPVVPLPPPLPVTVGPALQLGIGQY